MTKQKLIDAEEEKRRLEDESAQVKRRACSSPAVLPSGEAAELGFLWWLALGTGASRDAWLQFLCSGLFSSSCEAWWCFIRKGTEDTVGPSSLGSGRPVYPCRGTLPPRGAPAGRDHFTLLRSGEAEAALLAQEACPGPRPAPVQGGNAPSGGGLVGEGDRALRAHSEALEEPPCSASALQWAQQGRTCTPAPPQGSPGRKAACGEGSEGPCTKQTLVNSQPTERRVAELPSSPKTATVLCHLFS